MNNPCSKAEKWEREHMIMLLEYVKMNDCLKSWFCELN